MAKPFDATLKQILDDYAADWAAWLAPRLGLPAGPLELVEPLDADLSTIQPMADKVFRLPGSAGLLHIELQTGWDGELPDRLHVYNALLHRRFGGPVRSVAILLRRDANAAALTSVLTHVGADGAEYLRFHYTVVRVWELSADQLLTGDLGLAPLGLLTADAATRMPALVKQLAARVEREVSSGEMQDRLLAASYILVGMLYDKEQIRQWFFGVQKMRESSTYQAILDEGREEGELKGVLKGLRVSLLSVLEARFGSVPKHVQELIQSSSDVDQLRAGFKKILAIGSADEFSL